MRDTVPLREAARTWLAIGLQSFGGPAGQIALMQRTLVDDKQWLRQDRFLHALSFCMLLPGPEAHQLAIYAGWLLNGLRGALVAGILFVLPGVAAMLALSAAYVALGETTFVQGLFAGIAPAVVAIVVQALARVGRRSLTAPDLVALAVGSFVALSLGAPFPLVILVAGVGGWLRARAGRRTPVGVPLRAAAGAATDEAASPAPRPSSRRSLIVLVAGTAIWLAPVAVAALLLRPDSTLVQQGLFFSGTALVTFGGAYAVLAYVAQQAVEVYGWVTPGEMLRGLALAESTPGPLILVVQFVAFLGAYRDPGGLPPWVAAVLAALLIAWVTLVPSFVFILLGAPYVERLRSNRAVAGALNGIGAAVVGVIANLAVYFALHTLFTEQRDVGLSRLTLEAPVLSSADPVALGITALALTLLLLRDWSVLRTLGVCAVLGTALGASGVG